MTGCSLHVIRYFSSFTILVVLFMITFFIDCSFSGFGICDKLKLIPGTIYYPRFEIYRFFTFFLVNSNILLLVFDICGFVSFEVLLEKRWNLAEKIKYLIITTWLSGFCCLIYYYIKFAITKTEADINYVAVYGSSAFVAGVTVISKQFQGEMYVNRAYFISKYITLIYLTLIFILSIPNLVNPITFPYSCLGFFFGWAYLRFAQKHTDGKRGDHRSSLSFVKFFPPLIQKVLVLPCNFIYASAVACGLISKIESDHEIISAYSLSKNTPNVSFDRHKKIALDDLNARLAASQNAAEPMTKWPSLFDKDPQTTDGAKTTTTAFSIDNSEAVKKIDE